MARGSTKVKQLTVRDGGYSAIALSGDRLFVATERSGKTELAAVPIDGDPAAVLATLGGEVTSVAADATNVYLASGQKLYRIPRAGGALDTIVDEFGYELAHDAERVYAAGFDKKDFVIRSVPKGGGEVKTLLRRTMTGNRLAQHRRIAVAGGKLFFSDSDDKSLVTISPIDGAVEDTQKDLGYTAHIVATGRDVFVVDEAGGRLRRVDPSAHTRKDVTSSQPSYTEIIAVDDHNIYTWDICTEGQHASANASPCPLSKRSLAGGEPVVVDHIRANLYEMLVDGECLYLVRQVNVGDGPIFQTMVQAMGKP